MDETNTPPPEPTHVQHVCPHCHRRVLVRVGEWGYNAACWRCFRNHISNPAASIKWARELACRNRADTRVPRIVIHRSRAFD